MIRHARCPGVLLITLMAATTALIAAAAETAKSPADYVDPRIDTHKSRWFYFSSACRPFGMVNLSPDTRTGDDWMHGYIYGDTKIRCFSHIHGWQLYGIAVLPVTGEVPKPWDMDACAADFSNKDEVIHPGYHKVVLKNYGITAELTSTTRVGFHRYQFPKDRTPKVIFNTGAALMAPITSSTIGRLGPAAFYGMAEMAPTMRRPKPFTVCFYVEFDRPIEKFDGWVENKLLPNPAKLVKGKNAGTLLTFGKSDKPLLMKVAISYVCSPDAHLNLKEELSHWDFDRVVRESRDDWNRWLSRIEVEGGSEAQKVKFYTDLWHALLGRRIVSDVNGLYIDMTGPKREMRQVGQVAGPFNLGRKHWPRFPHHNFDALWGSHWSLNILWSFAYPEVMDAFCNTMVDMYHNGGLIPRGPSGGNYTYVMIGDPAASFFAAAYDKGIRNYDVKAAYEGLLKNARPGGIRDHAGYEHDKNACGGGMQYYVDRGYVPEDIEGKGGHKDGASMTLEYAYQDWCLAQLALVLGHKDDAKWLLERSGNYRNVWDASVQSMRPRMKDGSWLTPFERVGPHAAKGFCEADAAIYTHYVPHDVPGLIKLFGGPKKYVAALDEQFKLAAKDNFVTEIGMHHLQWVDYGNQPSTAMAHLFNLAGAPWLSQKWVRAVKEQTFGDITPNGGYLGDEDQGQMGSLSALMAMGLFDVAGGAAVKPTYQITAPVFDRVAIHLNPDYFARGDFTIVTRNNSPRNIYIQRAWLNGNPLERCWFDHADLVRGGRLEIELGPEPNRAWGLGK